MADPDFATMLYGGAQHAAEQQGQGMSQAISSGAELAFHKEQLDQAQQRLQMQQQELQAAKMDRAMGWFEAGSKMDDGPVKKAFMENWVPNGINAMGLTDTFHPDSLKMAQKDPALVAYITDGVKKGTIDPAMLFKAARDPETMASFAAQPEYKVFGGQQAIQETLQNSIGDIRAAADAGYTNKVNAAKQAIEQQKADTQERRAAAMEALAAKKADEKENAGDKTLGAQIISKFEPLSKEQASLASAQDARDRVLSQMKKDPSGRSVSPQDMGAMIYPVLHNELGRVNAIELGHQLNVPGIESMTEAQLVKVLGGVNPTAIPGLTQRVSTSLQEFDARKQRLVDAYKPLLEGNPKSSEVIKAYSTPAYRPPADAITYKMSNGKSYSAAQLQQLRSNPNVDPKVAAEIDKVLKGSK